MNTRTQTARSVVSMLLALTMMSVVTHSIAGSVDADMQAQTWLRDHGIKTGWDDQKKRYISIGWEGFDVASYLIPTDLMYKNLEQLEKLEMKIEKQKQLIAKYLADVDPNAAEDLQGDTLGDRMNAAMDAAIQILDKKYWTEEWAEKKKKKYDRARKRYAEALKEYDRLIIEAEKTANYELDETFTVRQSLATRWAVLEARANIVEYIRTETVASTNAGTIETRSTTPLYGAIPIAQFESWDKDSDQYEVVTVVMWSLAMEKLVRSAIRGESVRVSPGRLSLEEFARGFEKEKRVNISGRFRDDKGVIYILGGGFAAVGGGQSLSTARVLAEQIAREEILMAIYLDISSHKKADREGGFQHDIAVHTFEGQEEQRINRQIRKLSGGKVVDPISQQPVYATVFALSLDDYAKSALE